MRVPLPSMPTDVVPPAAMTAFHRTFFIVTLAPDWSKVAFQAEAIRWAPPKVKVSAQPFTAVGPVLVTFRLATKPDAHRDVVS